MFTAYLPTGLLPWAKALNAFLSAAALLVLHGVVTGEWDPSAIEALVGGGLLTAVVFATPNAGDPVGEDGDNSTVTKP